MLSRAILSFSLLIAFCFTIQAQLPGELDPTFGTDGKQLIPVGTLSAFGQSLVIQPDGKIVIAAISNNGANTDFTLYRMDPSGEPDPEFGDNGIVITDLEMKSDIAETVAIDQEGRIVVAGYTDTGERHAFVVARYLSDGQLDDTFGAHGYVITPVGVTAFCEGMVVRTDNKILLGGFASMEFSGTNEFILVQYKEDGSLDSTFNHTGIVMTNFGIGAAVANAITLQPDGKILLAGQVFNEATFLWETAIARYHPDGNLDNAWDHDGIMHTGIEGKLITINAIALQEDGKVVVGGFAGTAPSNNLFLVERYFSNGTPDLDFGTEGHMLESFGAQDNQIMDIVIQPDQQIIVAGSTLFGNMNRFALARLDTVGQLDGSFDGDGKVTTTFSMNDGINAIALQEDGKLMTTGVSFTGNRFEIAAARYVTGIVTSIDQEHISFAQASVYPNPASEVLHISFDPLHTGEYSFLLCDLNGKKVIQFPVMNVEAGSRFEASFPLSDNMPGGMYFLNITYDRFQKGIPVLVNR